MYEYITGSLEEITPTDAIVEACGVGYDLQISLSTFSKLQNARGKAVKLYTTWTAKTTKPSTDSPTRPSAPSSSNLFQ